MGVYQKHPKKAGYFWSRSNASQAEQSRVGWLLCIVTPWYLHLKSVDKTFLCQKNAVVTFDEGIYCEAKRIQWAILLQLANVIARLGGFHRAMKTSSVFIGKRMTKSGAEDLWIESDKCGSNVATKIDNQRRTRIEQ